MTQPNPDSPLFDTYARADLAFVRGEGAWLEATDGRRYLDFMAGIAVDCLGHAHPHLVEALRRQAERLWHVSNVFQIPEQARLAERLVEVSFADRVFFCNSGAEATECAFKTARRYHHVNGAPERWRIVTFEGAFHGRTLAGIAAGGQAKHLEGFGRKVDGFDQVPFADPDGWIDAIGPETAAIMVEPIQGESGIRVVPHDRLRAIRQLCDERGLLLILDEVQCGMGRTGSLFAHELAGVTPDIMPLAKGLGGGFPLGACLATERAAAGMTPGSHGTTFGGNPLAMAVGNAVLDVILSDGFLGHVQATAASFKQHLAALLDRHPGIVEQTRGEGLMLGLKCRVPNGQVVDAAREQGLLTVAAGDNVVRFLPPLIVGAAEVEEAVARLDRALGELARRQAA
ncbi:MAG TPA: aspartate aminotransferase family protein [Afifellaceae bacterium]|nr:aspartate aminotransferase family protein [Afifellaceae bacterium]